MPLLRVEKKPCKKSLFFFITIAHSEKAARLRGALRVGKEILAFFLYKAMARSNAERYIFIMDLS